MLTSAYLNNQFLIAMPAMADPNFARSVVLMCQHSDEGAMGLVINRTIGMSLMDLLEQMGLQTQLPSVASASVFLGGPVQTERGFVLHDVGPVYQSSISLSDELMLTTSKDVLEAISLGKGPRRFLVALGYAGWGAGQLEEEIRANAWLNMPAATDLVLSAPIEARWQAAVQRVGVDLSRLSSQSGHA